MHDHDDDTTKYLLTNGVWEEKKFDDVQSMSFTAAKIGDKQKLVTPPDGWRAVCHGYIKIGMMFWNNHTKKFDPVYRDDVGDSIIEFDFVIERNPNKPC